MLESDHQHTTKQHLYDGEKKENSVNKSVNSYKDQRNVWTCESSPCERCPPAAWWHIPPQPTPPLSWKQRAPDEVLQQVNTNTPHHRSYSINTANTLPQPYLETYGLFLSAEGKPALMLNSGIILSNIKTAEETLPGVALFFFPSLTKHTSFQKFPLMRIVSLASFSLVGETVLCSKTF